MDVRKDLATWIFITTLFTHLLQFKVHPCYGVPHSYWNGYFRLLVQVKDLAYVFIFWDSAIKITIKGLKWHKPTVKKKAGEGPSADRSFNKFLGNRKSWVNTDEYSRWMGCRQWGLTSVQTLRDASAWKWKGSQKAGRENGLKTTEVLYMQQTIPLFAQIRH